MDDSYSPRKEEGDHRGIQSLAEEIKRKFGEGGARAVDEVVAKHKALNFAKGY